MLDKLLALIDKTNTYKKVVLLLLTGIAVLIIYIGFKAGDIAILRYKWEAQPIILNSYTKCSVIQVKEEAFILTLPFPVPDDVSDQVFRYSISYWTKQKPTDKEVTQLCNSLMLEVMSDSNEKLIKPYVERMQERGY